MRMGRNCPDLDAALLFELDEWRGAYILNGKKPPASTKSSASSRDSVGSSGAKETSSRA